MIATLTGELAEILPDGAVIDVNGVGYRVFMPSSAVAKLPKRGAKAKVHTHTHVREDAITLFGFLGTEERDLFDVLISVNGIGPKNALAILSAYTPANLRRSVVAEDLAALTTIPGIGKKTAARIVLELKEKLALPDLAIVIDGPSGRARLAEVRDALLQLGYSTTEARDALEQLPESEESTTEELLRNALKELAAR
ncbi:MAG: Holliday junction branch migration protein RuvA [Actinomycetota bacterium]|nr:Holliday junction branch migration protein RuvA [Actinomycetota bacterium]